MTASAQGDAAAHVIDRFDLGAPSKWDYAAVDTPGHRLFLTRGTRVQVIDTATGGTLGEVAGTKGVHGIAFAPDLGLGFTSNGASDSITAFDLGSLKPVKEIAVDGKSPDAMVYDPASHHLYSFNGHSANVTVIDARSLAAVSTFKVDGRPEFAVLDDSGHIFVNLELDHGAMNVIDTRTATVTQRWALPGCENPTGLALDASHHRLFSVCANHVMAVTDAVDGHAVASIPIGDHPDAALYDAARGLVYSSNGEGSLTVIRQDDADHYRPLTTVATVPGAKTMARDPTLHRLYLPAVVDGRFVVLVVQE